MSPTVLVSMQISTYFVIHMVRSICMTIVDGSHLPMDSMAVLLRLKSSSPDASYDDIVRTTIICLALAVSL